MKKRILFSLVLVTTVFVAYLAFGEGQETPADDRILEHIVDPKTADLRLFHKDDTGGIYHNFGELAADLEKKGKDLVFGMNAGMFMEDHRPLGLYIEDGVEMRKVNRVQTAYGNFYMQPNGVFYLTGDGDAVVMKTVDFHADTLITYATQSGPMLLIDGSIHPKFNEGSANVHIRNGVGILPDGRALFAVSKEPINLFDLATHFKNRGCKNALYLDGGVCRTYLPEKQWVQLDGKLGPLIGVVE